MNKTMLFALAAVMMSMGLSACNLNADSGNNAGVPGSSDGGSGGAGDGSGSGDGSGDGDGDTVGAAGECQNRLADAAGAAAAITTPLCLGCGVADEGNVLTADTDDLAVVTAAVGALPLTGQASVGIDVTLAGAQAGTDTNPGFIVSFPDVSALSAGVLPDLTVSTVTAGEVVDSETYAFGILQNSIALGALGLIDINNAEVFIGVPATTAYDGLRIELTGLVANALIDVNVHGVCTDGISGSLAGDSPI
ncbi:MAG: hypothetical protein ACSHXK_12945 [Oceanococcus sp.]